ncbi:uncharacterized protein RBU33_008945 [Hipposideros larvatus]
MSENTGLGPGDTNRTTLQSDARNSTAEARGQPRGPPPAAAPVLSRVPRTPARHAAGCGLRAGAGRARRAAGAGAPRSARRQRRAGRRAGTRSAASARRGRRAPRPRALTFEDRAELLQGHVPGGPALREGPGRRRGGGGGAELTARRGGGPAPPPSRPPGCLPAGRAQVLRPAIAEPPGGRRAARAPRRAPPPAPRLCVPSTGPEPSGAEATDGTKAARRSACGRGAGPAQVAGAGSPGSFKRGARAPRAGSAPARMCPPRPARPRAPRALWANRSASGPAASRPGGRGGPRGAGAGAAVPPRWVGTRRRRRRPEPRGSPARPCPRQRARVSGSEPSWPPAGRRARAPPPTAGSQPPQTDSGHRPLGLLGPQFKVESARLSLAPLPASGRGARTWARTRGTRGPRPSPAV